MDLMISSALQLLVFGGMVLLGLGCLVVWVNDEIALVLTTIGTVMMVLFCALVGLILMVGLIVL